MKFRSGFVTNSSSSSFITFNVKNTKLFDFLTSLGLDIKGVARGEFSDGMEIILPTGEKIEFWDLEGDWFPTPEDCSSISSWVMQMILTEVESVYPAKEIDEYSDFTIALLTLLNEKGVLNFDMEDTESWDRDKLDNELQKLGDMDADIEEAEVEFYTGFEGEICHMEYLTAKNGYSLSITMDEYDDDDNREIFEGLKIFLLGDDFDDEESLIEFIEDNNGIVCDELTEDVDYVVCNNYASKCKEMEFAKDMCIPVISEEGFLYRFDDGNPFEDDEDLYGDLFECTYEGEFYDMFYNYGIGRVSRIKLK